MRRIHRIVLLATFVAVMPVLAGCADFDMDKLDVFGLSEKKKLPGDRKPVFPEGVPGVTQGIPTEFIKGNQPPPDAALAAPVAPVAAAPAADAQEAVEEKPRPKPKRASTAKPKSNAAAPAQPAAAQQPQPAQQAQTPWPAPAASAPPPSGSAAWPAPPPAGTFQR